jgi:bile acid:Na+ symporter, BASS family
MAGKGFHGGAATLSLESFVPAIVFLLMTIVGADIAPAQLAAVLRTPRMLLAATLAQAVVLPLLAVLIIWILRPPAALAGGLLLVAASPGGALSNYYCTLARLNVPLSVTLTFLSSAVALAAMPLLLVVIVPAALGVAAFGVPVGELAVRLLLFVMFPVGLGMALRRLWPLVIERNARTIRVTGMVLLAAFLVLVLVDQKDAAHAMLYDAGLVIAGFTALALLAGWQTARLLSLPRVGRAVFAVEFSVRNVGIAAVLALTTFQQPEFAAFGALFLVIQFPLLVLASLLIRKTDAAGPLQGRY